MSISAIIQKLFWLIGMHFRDGPLCKLVFLLPINTMTAAFIASGDEPARLPSSILRWPTNEPHRKHSQNEDSRHFNLLKEKYFSMMKRQMRICPLCFPAKGKFSYYSCCIQSKKYLNLCNKKISQIMYIIHIKKLLHKCTGNEKKHFPS